MGKQQVAPHRRKHIHAPEQIGVEHLRVQTVIAGPQHRRPQRIGLGLARIPDGFEAAAGIETAQQLCVQRLASDHWRLAFKQASNIAIGLK
jgi:hypothetical protein